MTKVTASAIGIAKNIPCVSNKNGSVKINNTGKTKLLDKAIIIEAKGLWIVVKQAEITRLIPSKLKKNG